MRKIGIITAMREEFESALKAIKNERWIDKNIVSGLIGETKVVLYLSGIGKVNSAIATTKLIIKYNVDFLVVIGVGGAVSKRLRIGDVVLASDAFQVDFDLRMFGHSLGKIPGNPIRYMTEKLQNIEHMKFKIGSIATSDKFLTHKDYFNIIRNFPNTFVGDMETGSVGQVAFKHSIPFIAIKIISDYIYEKEQYKRYKDNYKDTIADISETLRKVIKELENG